MTWREYLCLVQGYQHRQAEEWRRTRLLATILLNVNRDPEKSAPLSPEEVFWLPGDLPIALPMQEEEFEATMARLAAFDNL